MDPETYESVTIKRPEFLSAELEMKSYIVKTAKGIYVVPGV